MVVLFLETLPKGWEVRIERGRDEGGERRGGGEREMRRGRKTLVSPSACTLVSTSVFFGGS